MTKKNLNGLPRYQLWEELKKEDDRFNEMTDYERKHWCDVYDSETEKPSVRASNKVKKPLEEKDEL